MQAIRPNRGQLKAIEERYWETIVPDAEVIAALHFLGKQVFIVSGGLAEPVRGFGKRLGVPPENIRAVELEYNELSGDWWRYYHPENAIAKPIWITMRGRLLYPAANRLSYKALAGDKHGRRMMIGDGASDLATRAVVDLFVGFGGVVARDKVIKNADLFITSQSLAPVLPIAAGASGYTRVKDTPHQAIFDKGLALIHSGGLSYQQRHIEQRIQQGIPYNMSDFKAIIFDMDGLLVELPNRSGR